jgi:hypothetical protein
MRCSFPWFDVQNSRFIEAGGKLKDEGEKKTLHLKCYESETLPEGKLKFLG